jgi:hypothetical protein
MKPFSDIHEVVRKPILAYAECGLTGIDHHGHYSQRHLPAISQCRPSRHSEPGGKAMTNLVTALCVICVFFSISVFLAHALDAYRTGEART